MVSIRLTDKQEKRIQQHIKDGTVANKSEFIRRAIDYYILHLENPYDNQLLLELESWIAAKKDVLHCNTDVTQNSTNVTHCNTDVTQKNTDVTICNTDVTSVTQNEHQNIQVNLQNPITQKLITELQMIKRTLNNPLNNETMPDNTLKMLSKKYDISKTAIQAWIVENKSWIKHGDFENMQCRM